MAWERSGKIGRYDHGRFSDEPCAYVESRLATGDTRCSRKAVALILDWIAKCDLGRCFQGTPYMFGSYLNNAIHCEAWCQCLKTLLARDQVTPIELLRALKSLHDQLAYLEIVTNGHAGGNAANVATRSCIHGCCGRQFRVETLKYHPLACIGPILRRTCPSVGYWRAIMDSAAPVEPDGPAAGNAQSCRAGPTRPEGLPIPEPSVETGKVAVVV
jgi:hypothetical protein